MGYSPWGRKQSDMTEHTSTLDTWKSTLSCINLMTSAFFINVSTDIAFHSFNLFVSPYVKWISYGLKIVGSCFLSNLTSLTFNWVFRSLTFNMIRVLIRLKLILLFGFYLFHLLSILILFCCLLLDFLRIFHNSILSLFLTYRSP